MSAIQKIIKKIKYELQFRNAHYYTRISEKISKIIYRRLLQKKLGSLPPVILQQENARLTLAILANKRNFYESAAALYSFCFWERNILVHYHEDGTLTQNEIGFLKKLFPGIAIFLRAHQDVKLEDYLASKGLSHCAKLRQHFIFSIRLFDMLTEKQTPYLLQIDSDVLFFSKPDEILNIVEKGGLNGCYNKDAESASYTFDDSIISKYIPVPMVRRFNAGVFMHNFDLHFFDFVENILINEPQGAQSWHLEQTIFAMYASLKGNFIELPKNYDLGRKERALGNKLTSEHYVHNTGSDFHKDFIYKLYPEYNRNLS